MPPAPQHHHSHRDYEEMMACSYLSAAGMKPEPSGAACWTPPAPLAGFEGPSQMMMPPPYQRGPLSLGAVAAPVSEPALDLSTTAFPPRQPRPPPSDDESE